MSTLKIYEYPESVLRQKAKRIEKITPEIKQKLSDMLETMYLDDGVGLAANQVGLLERLVVIDVSHEKDDPKPLKMINPEIIKHSDETSEGEEGCLSLPDQSAVVERYDTVTVRYMDEEGMEHTIEGKGLLSVALQHELDHLEGKLFIDRISPLKRNIIIRKLRKDKRRS
ncbi:MAG: peptide deformylase [Alphaproteobacteria bacterium]|nr:peptide deformylase [Alphaproteobacteria bacterium]